MTGNVTRTSAGRVRGAPKTRRGYRRVPVPEVVRTALRAHRRLQAVQRLAVGPIWSDNDWVLVSEVGDRVEPRSLCRAQSKWAASAGLSDHGMHTARQCAATILLTRLGRADEADAVIARADTLAERFPDPDDDEP